MQILMQNTSFYDLVLTLVLRNLIMLCIHAEIIRYLESIELKVLF